MKKYNGYKLLRELSPLDLATILYMLCSAVYIGFGATSLTSMLPHLAIRVLLLVLILGLAVLGIRFNENKALKFIRNLYPLLFLGFFYTETSCMKNIIFSTNFDSYLFNAEQSLWNCQPSLAFSMYLQGEWFNEFMNLCYFSYYIIISLSCIVLFTGKPGSSQKDIFTVIFSFYLYYAIFAVFPVIGPHYYIPTAPEKIPLHFFGKIMRWLIEGYEQPTGAFPSSHVGIALIIARILYQHHKTLFAITLPFVLGICFATVYIKAHYLLDVIAGIISAPVFIIISEKTYAKFLLYGKMEHHPELRLTDKGFN